MKIYSREANCKFCFILLVCVIGLIFFFEKNSPEKNKIANMKDKRFLKKQNHQKIHNSRVKCSDNIFQKKVKISFSKQEFYSFFDNLYTQFAPQEYYKNKNSDLYIYEKSQKKNFFIEILVLAFYQSRFNGEFSEYYKFEFEKLCFKGISIPINYTMKLFGKIPEKDGWHGINDEEKFKVIKMWVVYLNSIG